MPRKGCTYHFSCLNIQEFADYIGFMEELANIENTGYFLKTILPKLRMCKKFYYKEKSPQGTQTPVLQLQLNALIHLILRLQHFTCAP